MESKQTGVTATGYIGEVRELFVSAGQELDRENYHQFLRMMKFLIHMAQGGALEDLDADERREPLSRSFSVLYASGD